MTRRSSSRLNKSFMQLPLNAMKLGFEAQSVIMLRMMKMAAGGPRADTEARLMTAEKVRAAIDVNVDAGLSALSGQGHLTPARTIALYRRRVRANQRRLLAGG